MTSGERPGKTKISFSEDVYIRPWSPSHNFCMYCLWPFSCGRLDKMWLALKGFFFDFVECMYMKKWSFFSHQIWVSLLSFASFQNIIIALILKLTTAFSRFLRPFGCNLFSWFLLIFFSYLCWFLKQFFWWQRGEVWARGGGQPPRTTLPTLKPTCQCPWPLAQSIVQKLSHAPRPIREKIRSKSVWETY